MSGVPALGDLDVEVVALDALKSDIVLRAGGLDTAHIDSLVEAAWPVEPILVHRKTMQVVDGHHRVAAARTKNMDAIRARLFEGPIDIAHVLAVRANVSHGLPLSFDDRREAARHILACYGEWSDRAIGASTGLSAKVVSTLRCASAEDPQLHTRLGRDGRRRPLDTASKRTLAAQLLSSQPELSLRGVARAVGLSPGTIRDVRERLRRGEGPVPEPTARQGGTSSTSRTQQPRADADAALDGAHADATRILAALSRDPALRMNQGGRDLLRWLHGHVIARDDIGLLQEAPAYSRVQLTALARSYAESWSIIAELLAAGCEHIPVDRSANEPAERRRTLSAC